MPDFNSAILLVLLIIAPIMLLLLLLFSVITILLLLLLLLLLIYNYCFSNITIITIAITQENIRCLNNILKSFS